MAGFDNEVVYGKNADYTSIDNQNVLESNGLVTDGKLWIGSTALNVGGTHINVGSITSPGGTISVGYSSPNITLDLSGGTTAIDSINVDASTPPGTDPVLPDVTGQVTFTGAQVAAGVVGTNVIRTDSLAVNTMTIEIQRSTAVASSTLADNGVCHFNSSQFSVDANGFVGLAGGGQAIDSIAVQTGTSPIVPTAGGLVTINGATVAAGTNPVRTDGTGANTMAVEVQISQALAATDATKIGLSNFDSARFTVDANGFVSLNGSGVGETITGDTGGPLSPTAGNWNILGSSGISTSGSGSSLSLTVTGGGLKWNDVTATSAAMAINNGYLADNAGLVTLTLPATAAQFSVIAVAGFGAGGWRIAQNSGQIIHLGSATTTSGVGGSLSSTNQYDCIYLLCVVANTTFLSLNSVGNLTVV